LPSEKERSGGYCRHRAAFFSLSEEAVWGYDTNLKMNPPLRTKDDVSAIKKGLRQGVIDAIASDHAPHTENEKEIEFERAEFGVTGLETELSSAITYLIQDKVLDMFELVKRLSVNPAKILGIIAVRSVPVSPPISLWFPPTKNGLLKKTAFIQNQKTARFSAKLLRESLNILF
jgi:dihydroorotase